MTYGEDTVHNICTIAVISVCYTHHQILDSSLKKLAIMSTSVTAQLDKSNEEGCHYFDPLKFRTILQAHDLEFGYTQGHNTGQSKYYFGLFTNKDPITDKYEMKLLGHADYLNGILRMDILQRGYGDRYGPDEEITDILIMDKSGVVTLNLTNAYEGVIAFRGKKAILGPFNKEREFFEFDAASLTVVKGSILTIAASSVDCYICGQYRGDPRGGYIDDIIRHNVGPNATGCFHPLSAIPVIATGSEGDFPHDCRFEQDNCQVLKIKTLFN